MCWSCTLTSPQWPSCYREALQICSLPKPHPLTGPAHRASKVPPCFHHSPLHVLLRGFNLWPKSIEIIDYTPAHPNWAPLVTTHIAASKDKAMSCIRMWLDEVQVFVDGSGMKGRIGAAVVVMSPPEGWYLQFQLGSEAAHTVFKGKLMGILLAVHLLHGYPRARMVLITMDNQAAIAALTNWERQPGQYLLNEIQAALKALWRTQLQMRVHIEWVPGHADVRGNERADALARAAAEGARSPQPELPQLLHKQLPVSITALKANWKKALYPKWAEQWACLPRYRKMLRIDPGMPSSKSFRNITNRPRQAT